MNDLIRRQDVLQLVNEMEIEYGKGCFPDSRADAEKAKDWFNMAKTILAEVFMTDPPAVDAVPIVRCKNCAYLDKYGCCNRLAGNAFWDPVALAVDDDDYCSRGERKTDEDY